VTTIIKNSANSKNDKSEIPTNSPTCPPIVPSNVENVIKGLSVTVV
jgi:hypothetical protein